MAHLTEERLEELGQQLFFGFPARDFESGGREQFIYLLTAGLNRESKLLDIGCGVLRAGYWLIPFLDKHCYCGIEPHQGRLNLGLQSILPARIADEKRPRFDFNDGFDTGVFGERFDFFLAYSIWTHATKLQICRMLDGFLKNSTERAKFLTTYLPADGDHPDYQGEVWHGTSHQSDVVGCIYHDSGWIEAECNKRGLLARSLGRDRTYGQSWLEIVKG